GVVLVPILFALFLTRRSSDIAKRGAIFGPGRWRGNDGANEWARSGRMVRMKRTRLYLTRHGQTVTNTEGRFCGHSETELTAKGRSEEHTSELQSREKRVCRHL